MLLAPSLTSLFGPIGPVSATIDINEAELVYLANHLQPEECRKLVAAAHFKSYNLPNALGQAEQAVPSDVPCIELLQHWNSARGEGRGETHEVLEHRLRQIGKFELADWLGKTVFHELGEDLERSLETGLKTLANEASTMSTNVSEAKLYPVIETNDPTEWSPVDSLFLFVLVALLASAVGLCLFMGIKKVLEKCRGDFRNRSNKRKQENYHIMVNDSNSESEDMFDVREHNP